MRAYRWRRVLGLIFLLTVVVVAGCSGMSEDPAAQSASADSPTGTATLTPGPATTDPPEPTDTPTVTPTADPDNPFGDKAVGVRILLEDGSPKHRTSVKKALRYWENRSERYAGYPIEFVTENPTAVRVQIKMVDEIGTCGIHEEGNFSGCADYNPEKADSLSTARIGTGYSSKYTFRTAVHEIGHLLGIAHGSPPEEYMAAIPPTGIYRENVSVSVTDDGEVSSPAQRREVRKALSYFESHDELNHSRELDWHFVHNPYQADLIIEYTDSDSECFGSDGGSCAGDPLYKDQHKIVLDDIDRSVAAYHVGYHVAGLLFDAEDIPEGLRGNESRSERENWP